MTRGEKRHFRAGARRHVVKGKNDYMKLFEALEKGKEVELPYLAAQRVYLRKMLVQSLATYRRRVQGGLSLGERLDVLETLFSKGQLELAEEVMERGLKLAEELGERASELALLKWKRRLLLKMGVEEEREWGGIAEAEGRCLEALEVENWWVREHDRLFLMAKKGNGSVEGRSKAPGIDPASFEGKLARCSAMGISAQIQRDHPAAVACFQENLAVWTAHPKQILLHPSRYLAALINYLRSLHLTKRYDAMRKTVEFHLGQAKLPRETALFMRLKCLNAEMVLCMNDGLWERAEECASELKAHKKALDSDPAFTRTARYNLALLALLQNNFQQAFNTLRELLDLPRSDAKRELQVLAGIWEVALCLETGNERLFPYRLRSLDRRYPRGDMPVWWRPLRELLRKMWKAERRKWRRMAGEMLEQAGGSYEGSLGWLEVSWWLEGLAGNRD